MESERLIHVGIVGHTGYAGIELVQLLQHHPRATPLCLDLPKRPKPATSGNGKDTSPEAALRRAARKLLEQPFAPAQGVPHLTLVDALAQDKVDVVLFATPLATSLAWVPEVLDAGVRCIDLSGAFRLHDADDFAAWYGVPHPHPSLLQEAVYGLPEADGKQIDTARLIANPGCHATAMILALWPVMQAGLVDESAGVVCDAKTGISGAGKKATSRTHYCATAENVSVYSALHHRHVPEVTALTGLAVEALSFSAQLIPIRRGLLAVHYFRLRPGIAPETVHATYAASYAQAPWVRVYPAGSLPDVASVVHSNYCHIGVETASGGRVLAVSALDNLRKGAASQAIQNLNGMYGFAETDGLGTGSYSAMATTPLSVPHESEKRYI